MPVSRPELGRQLNLSTELVPKGMKNRPGTTIKPTYITIHNTDNANKGADADAHSKFVRKKGYYIWKGKKKWVSWHYTVDDTEVIKQLPLNEKALHAGPANIKSIAIENCMHKGFDEPAAHERLAKLIAALRYDFGMARNRVVTHKFWTNKNCPSRILPVFNKILDRSDEILGDIRKVGPRERLTGEAEEFNYDDVIETPRPEAIEDEPEIDCGIFDIFREDD